MKISTSFKNLEVAGNGYWQTVDFTPDILKYDICPAVLSSSTRKRENFVESHFIFIDIDNKGESKYTIEDFKKDFVNYDYYIATSKSHQKTKTNKSGHTEPAADRFHAFLPVSSPITTADSMHLALKNFVRKYPFCDTDGNNPVRLLCHAPDATIIVNETGTRYDPDFSVIDDFKAPPIDTAVSNWMVENHDTIKDKLLAGLHECAERDMFANREDWVKLASALKSEGFGYSDFLALSYNDAATQREAYNVWKSIDSTRVSGATLVWFVRQIHPRFLKKELNPVMLPHNERIKGILAEQTMQEASKAVANGVDCFHLSVPPSMWKREHCNIHQTDHGEKITPRPSMENVKIMLDFYGIKVWFDEMEKKIQIDYPGRNTDNDNMLMCRIISAGYANNLPKDAIRAALSAIASQNIRHPFREWLDAIEWDGRDYLMDMFRNLELQDPAQAAYSFAVFRKWCRSQVAALYEPHGIQSRGVLTLQGPQGCGKTMFFKNLYPKGKRFFREDLLLDPDNKDNILSMISSACCELGELESTLRRDNVRLKGVISRSEDTVRSPYAERAETFERRTVLCATVNSSSFLKDDTGNSRFWIIPVKSTNYQHGIDLAQFWACVKADYLKAKDDDEDAIWWLGPDEIEALTKVSKAHTEIDNYTDVVMQGYDVTEPATRCISTLDIARELGFDNPHANNTLRYLAKTLEALKFKTGSTKSKNRGFWVPACRSNL